MLPARSCTLLFTSRSADGIDSIDILWLRDGARLAVVVRFNAVVICALPTNWSVRTAKVSG
jgi:hypothetical protein